MRMKARCFLLFLLIALPAALLADTLETVYFRGNMSPANEVPAVTNESANATGRATITFHLRRNDAGAIVSGVVDFDVDYNFPVPVTVRGLHIHEGVAGVNGPIRIDTGLSATSTLDAEGAGNIFRQVVVTSGDALTALSGVLANPSGWYVNLHTSVNTGGLMRSQLTRMEVAVVRADMSPANEVPPIPGLNASASGSAFILFTRDANGVVNDGTVYYDVNYNFPGPITLTGLHIHPGAAGANGPARLNTPLSATNPVVDADGVGSLAFKVEANNPGNLDTLRIVLANPAGAYMNVHTSDNTGGATRGQLQPTSLSEYQLTMTPANEVPPIPDLNASAVAKASLYTARNSAGQITSGTVVFDANYQWPGNVIFRGFHIHDGAAGVNGPVRIDSGLSATNTVTDEDGVGNLIFRINVGGENALGIATLRGAVDTPENHYLNLHTTVNTGGAIRSQLGIAPAAPAVPQNGFVSATFAPGVNLGSGGSLISIFGTNLGRNVASAGLVNGRLPTTLAGASVNIGGVAAPLLYASPNQLNVQVPFEVPAGNARITVITPGGTSSTDNVTFSAFAPAIFVAVKNSDFSLMSSTNAVRAGDAIAVFATGLGAASPAVASGQLPAISPLSPTVTTPTATIGGLNAQVAASLLAPGFAGVYQVNVIVPAGTPSGSQPLRLTIAGVQSNAVNINVQ
jgi:uncharacterized protein (TIGR03437 family)